MRQTAEPLGGQPRRRDTDRPATGDSPRVAPREALGVLLAFAAGTLAYTWSLASRPASHALANPDTWVNFWTHAWVVRQALRDPLHLFDANAYWPWPQSLGYAESLFAQSALAAPVLWLGGGAVLAHNLVLLASFPLAGLGLYLLARELGASRVGSFVAGFAYAFCAYRFEHLVHTQSVSAQWFPFALLYLRRVLRSGRLGDALLLALFALLQALSSGYYAVLLGAALGVALIVQLRVGLERGTLFRAVAALALAAGLALALLWPHHQVQQRHGLHRAREEAVLWSARPASYLDPGPLYAAPHLRALHAWLQEREHLYPGSAALVLGVVGLVALGGEGARLALALAATGLLLSFGPELQLAGLTLPGPMEWLRGLPAVSGLRTPVRMSVLAQLGLALLAAFGWDALARRSPRLARLAPALIAAMLLEAWPAGLGRLVATVPAPPPAAEWLATAPRGPVLELPWDTYEDSALYLYWSTRHWQPLVNGYGAFEPPGNRGLGALGRRFPRPYAVRRLREAGVRWVVVHLDRVREGQRRRLQREPLPPEVRLAAALASDRVYELLPAGAEAAPASH